VKRFLVLLSLVLLTPTILADCDITGAWTDSVYQAGDNMVFEGDITPEGGFIRGVINNPLGQSVAVLKLRQIDNEYQITLPTNSSFLNGTYTAQVYYVDYANTTLCGNSVSSTTRLESNYTGSDIEVSIELVQTYNKATHEYDIAPTQSGSSTITGTLTTNSIDGLASAFKINDVSLVPGDSIGEVNIYLTQCNADEEMDKAFREISHFLDNNFSNAIYYSQQMGQLENQLEMCNSSREHEIEMKKEWAGIAAGKPDWWLMIVFIFLGMVILRGIQMIDLSEPKEKYSNPI